MFSISFCLFGSFLQKDCQGVSSSQPSGESWTGKNTYGKAASSARSKWYGPLTIYIVLHEIKIICCLYNIWLGLSF